MRRFTLPSILLVGCLLILPVRTHADPLVVGAGTTLSIGDPAQPTSRGYDSLTVESGATLRVEGDVTLTIAGDILINGRIAANPTNKAPAGAAGQNGTDGQDNSSAGANAGTGGILGEIGGNWTSGGAPRLTLTSQGSVFINGAIDLQPAFEGGEGGRGGNGGKGGSGVSGPAAASGGFGGQAGSANQGGHAGLPGANVRITGDVIEMATNAMINLNNQGKGGKGGAGGNGGHGGAGGTGDRGAPGGGGGPAGNGGQGGLGGTGGILSLTADRIVLRGTISLKGGPGGDGGPAGIPGNGGDAGNSTGQQQPGPRGGDAGNVGGSGPRGGRGGTGGAGGSLTILARQELINSASISVDGGNGGNGGAGQTNAVAKGGKAGGGTPPGDPGLNSGELLGGTNGVQGAQGIVTIRGLFTGGEDWQVPPGGCGGPFTHVDAGSVTRHGWVLCGGDCLARSSNINPDNPLELRFDYRFLTTTGNLEFSLGGRSIHSVQAPASVRSDFQSVSVLLTDPALRTPSFQELRICLQPQGAQVQLANVTLRSAPAATNPPPEITIQLGAGGTTIQFTWQSVTGQSYQLQSRASLSQGTWTNVGAAIPGTGATLTSSIPVPANPGTAFYRVMVSSP